MKNLHRKVYLWLLALRGQSSEKFHVHGVDVFVPKSVDFNLRYLFHRGRPYEEAEATLIRKYLSPGTPVIELGGCLGVISAVIRNQIGPEPKHIVVEAIPELAEIAKINAQAGGGSVQSQLIQAAIDYSGGDTVTFALGKNPHVGHIASETETGVTVPATTLAKIREQMPEGPFALVCDIEGAEIALIDTESETMQDIDTFILEVHPKVYPDGERTVDSLIEKIGTFGLKQQQRIDNVICFVRS
ncbi:FkbM family methyltransferase [Thalassovita sp.]|uniref:FkbM family methyltransferase n=1 Tax=Thalassovita sp. TaxID=1979401 RepID=UPI002B27A971|nr:FkbM family methyltransferase [Thalassovita sp.]